MIAAPHVADWSAVLRGLAAGASITVLVVVPVSAPTQMESRTAPVTHYILPMSSEVDGNDGLRPVFMPSRQGLALPEIEGAPAPQPTEIDIPATLATALREDTGLSVDTLAQMMQVTRMTYHKWLAGAGIRSEHLKRLNKLNTTFRTLRFILGDRLPTFLSTATASGKRPIDLLEAEDHDLVIGYALQIEPLKVSASPTMKASAGLAGLPDWTHPGRPLNWKAPPRTAFELAVAMDQLSPAPTLPDADTILVHSEDDGDNSYIAFGVILE